MRLRKGAIPNDATGVLYLGGIGEGASGSAAMLEGWAIIERAASRPPWLSLKLIHFAGRVPGAANFWLGWNVERKCYARTNGAGRLVGARPDLYAAVERMMRSYDVKTGALDGMLPEDGPAQLAELRGLMIFTPVKTEAGLEKLLA